MKNFANFLVVLGVCLGALGASGFHTPASGEGTREDNALTLFAFGIAALAVGGFISLKNRRAAVAPGTAHAGKLAILAELEAIRSIVVELDDGRAHLSSEAVRERIDALLETEYFDLAEKREELIQLLGFSGFAKVWDGVAVAERLLARAWSMCTDGHDEEGFAELPLARAALDNALVAMRAA